GSPPPSAPAGPVTSRPTCPDPAAEAGEDAGTCGGRRPPWHPVRVGGRTLVLASRSPARRAPLQAAGPAPRVVVGGVDEDGVAGLAAATATCGLAERKASAVAERLAAGEAPAHDPPPVVVACDSVLDVDGELRGRPAGPKEAARWWRGYRGRT